VTAACPACAASTVDGDRFCESCGTPLSTVDPQPVAVAGGGPAGGAWLSSRADAGGPCTTCGSDVGGDGFCDGCGRRRNAGRDHAEHDLPGVAAVTAATTAAVEAIEVLIGGGDVAGAYRSASAAVAELAGSGAPFDAPACTFLAAVVEGGQLTVGWVGDSRAYWLDGAGARCLTVDDSLAGQLAAAGVDADALRLSAQAAALTRWLGADAPAGDPHVTTLRPATAGVLLLSSDGLTRYPTWTDAIEGNGGPAGLARRLTAFARDAGGVDNITVVAVQVEAAIDAAPDSGPDRGGVRP
jgi:PPM family protein phosphatase